jgi:nucleoid-associated protein YgaU
MNTKVKIGIAAVIVTALVALIVLDQKTAPQDEASKAAPAAADPASPAAGGADENEATHLFKKFQKTFEAEPPAAAPAPIKGSEPPPGKEIRPQGPVSADEYVVQPGDSYAEIARKKYGDSGLWEVIAKANPGVKATALRAGKKIVIPLRADPKAEPADAPVAVRAESPAAPAGLLPRVYEVASGDTLSGISKKLYNTTRHAAALFEANRDKLDNANDLRVGMKLTLPEGVGRLENATPAVAAPGTTAGTAPVAADPAPAAGGKIHQVAPSESLWKIAEKYCGDKGILEMIQAIVKANPDKIKDERTMLRVGWQLVIPE